MEGGVKLLSWFIAWMTGSGLGKKISSGLGVLSGRCQWTF